MSTLRLPSARASRPLIMGLGFLAVVACGGAVSSLDESSPDDADRGSSSTKAPSSSATAPSSSSSSKPPTTCRPPAEHRVAATACDGTRTLGPDPTPDPGHPYVKCTTHADCTEGKNGRCTGNSHDGWQCTYDQCQSDSECNGGKGVCECQGGFRSDNDVCLETGCHVDADCAPVGACGTGFCSPSLGSCGHYAKTVGYFCHTPKDECTDDADCVGGEDGQKPYCRYEPAVGHWKCSTQECAG